MSGRLSTAQSVGHEHVADGAICIHDLSFRYPGGALALEHIDLHVARGVTLAVVGPNGAGKTTLLRVLLGLCPGYTGEVRVEGVPPAEAIRRRLVTWVPQRGHLDAFFPISVFQLCRLGLVGKSGFLRGFRRDDIAYLRHVVDVIGLADLAERPIAHLSGGQMQRALIARALAPRPKLLLLDEPTVGIDAAGQEQFRLLLDSIKSEFDVTLVMVSHDLPTMLSKSQRIACLNRTLHFHDSPDKLTSEVLHRVFHCSTDGVPIAAPQEHRHEGEAR